MAGMSKEILWAEFLEIVPSLSPAQIVAHWPSQCLPRDEEELHEALYEVVTTRMRPYELLWDCDYEPCYKFFDAGDYWDILVFHNHENENVWQRWKLSKPN
jgi:hypothetical protein